MLNYCRTERTSNERRSLFLFWSIAKMPGGCRIARFRDGHMGSDLGHHEGSMAARPKGLAPAMEGDRGIQRIRTMPSTNSDLHTLLGYPSSPHCEGMDCSPMLRTFCR